MSVYCQLVYIDVETFIYKRVCIMSNLKFRTRSSVIDTDVVLSNGELFNFDALRFGRGNRNVFGRLVKRERVCLE